MDESEEYLHSKEIFLLPYHLQDSKRFEGIDVDFKELAYDAEKTPNVVEATNKPGLYEQLEDIQSRWVIPLFVYAPGFQINFHTSLGTILGRLLAK